MHFLLFSRMTTIVMAILLSFSSSPLWAQEDVYFCNMMENIDIKNHDMQKIELYHFKFMVTPEKIIFGSDGYF